MSPSGRLQHLIDHELWERDLGAMPRPQRWLVNTLRMVWVMARDLYDGQINLRAMSLVYTTLLSIVPVLALSFSVAKGLGLHNQLEPLLFQFLEPLGPKGQEMGQKIMGFVQAADAKVLGGIGIALLAWAAVSLIQKVEDGFNFVWRVQQSRNLMRRISGYLGVLITGPLLIVVGLAAAASLMSSKLMQHVAQVGTVGTAIDTAGRLTPYLFVFAAFMVAYMLIPNTKVRWRSAAVGAAIGGALWVWTGMAFAKLGASSTQYDAIYAGFAIVLLLMIWLYLCWLILLFGSQIAFYHQNPRLMTRHRFRLQLGGRLREKLALLVMYLVGAHYWKQQPPWTLESLSDRLRVTGDALETVIARLHGSGLLLAVDEDADSSGFVPARDMSTITLREIVAAVRDPGNHEDHPEHYVQSVARVDQVVDELEGAVANALGQRTLRDLVTSEARA
jgi:membrane protein